MEERRDARHPDSLVRRMLFELAERIGDRDGDRDDLALNSAAYRALTKVLHEQAVENQKTPLQVQADARRTTREIRAMGVDVPDIEFTNEDFTLPPTTPGELAGQLGYADEGRAVRRLLRRGFSEHKPYARWEPLSAAQINYVRAHIPCS